MTELVRLSQITKTFPGVKALDGVSLDIKSGEVLALVGENGAGKSTLMKILSGIYAAGSYGGEVLVKGEKQNFGSPLDAEVAGISIIHQELSTFSHLSVAENIFAGHWQKRAGMVDWPSLYKEAEAWLETIGAQCRATDRMGDLSVGTQQMVEIAKALSKKSEVLILDEPTSALTPREVEKLFEVIKELRNRGKGLVYISHKMDEIYEICDRITVLRDGKTVDTQPKADMPEGKLISLMVGRSLERMFPPMPVRNLGETVLRAENFSGKNKAGETLFESISFGLKRGEILGFAGLLGAGRSELLKAVFGDTSVATTGTIELNGKIVNVKTPRQALNSGISFVSEDRKRESILPKRSLNENISLARLAAGNLFKLLNIHHEEERAQKGLKKLNTRFTTPAQEIQNLSGGNQQKVIIARTLEVEPDVIILDEPTRGVDVGAKYEIYEILFRLAQSGKGLLVVSSDLPELMGLCDRILVLSEGKNMGCLERSQFSQEAIMRYAVGRRESAAS